MVTARVDQIPAPWIIKENGKPLRRAEEASQKHKFPILQDMTAMMQLPKPAGCKFLKNKWIVCHADKNPHLSSLR